MNLQQSFSNIVLDNKEIQRAISKFDSGLSLLQPQIDSLLRSVSKKYNFLWSDDLEQRLTEFADANPSEIEDEFIRCQLILDEMENAEKQVRINCIAVDFSETYNQFSNYVSEWKRKLVKMLATIYRNIFDEIDDFIRNTDCILRRKLNNEEDFTAIIECLLDVQKNNERYIQITRLYGQYFIFYLFLLLEWKQICIKLRRRTQFWRNLMNQLGTWKRTRLMDCPKDMPKCLHKPKQLKCIFATISMKLYPKSKICPAINNSN